MNSAPFLNMKSWELKSNQLFTCSVDQYLSYYIGLQFNYTRFLDFVVNCKSVSMLI